MLRVFVLQVTTTYPRLGGSKLNVPIQAQFGSVPELAESASVEHMTQEESNLPVLLQENPPRSEEDLWSRPQGDSA